MRIVTPIIGAALALPLSAQITITQADLPSAGDTMRYQTTAAGNVDLTLTGPDVVWDFSTLAPLLPGADTAVTVSSTPLLYQFFFNNPILYAAHDADYAMKGVGFGFQQLQVEDVYDYYKKSSGAFSNVGFGATINGLPASVRRIPVDRIYQLPVEYGNTDASSSAFQLEVPNMLFFGQQQERSNEVDGWGTLILPADTFEVLRVRTVLEKHDTLYVQQFGFGFGFDEPQTVEYKWLAQGMDAPVLIVTTVAGVPTTARFYYDPEVTTGVAEAAGRELPQVFPNPASHALTLVIPDGAGARAVIVDLHGRIVRDLGKLAAGTRMHIDVSGLAAGAYTVRALDTAAPWSVPFIVE